MIKYVKFFDGLSKNDVLIAGGKGASLGEMTKAGFPIPPGFVVLSPAFDEFLKESDLAVEIESQLKKVNSKKTHTIDDASEIIRQLINKYKMPAGLQNEILAAFDKLGAKYVAVRSSATAEDSAVASWAGELESYLGVQKQDLLKYVKQCWSSLFTPRAIFYRLEKGLGDKKVSVAVVVQKMIESEVAGVCFTAHPVTQDKNQMVIEASWGLGESVVAGKITPDTYIIDKSKLKTHLWGEPQRNDKRSNAKLAIIDINVNTQTTEIKRIGKITKERPVPVSKAKQQCLSNKQILELAKTCQQIENHYTFPCDIEWARDKDKLYVVQSRPITTLKIKKSIGGEMSFDKKFLDQLGENRILRVEGDFLPFLVASDWLNYYIGKKRKNIHPTLYAFGRAKKIVYVDLNKYRKAAELTMKKLVSGSLQKNDIQKMYDFYKHKIDKQYNANITNLCSEKIENEKTLFALQRDAYNYLVELVAHTLFVEQLDESIIKMICEGQRVSEQTILELTREIAFLSFETRNNKKIVEIVEKRKNIEEAFYCLVNYTHIPNIQELKNYLKLVNVKELKREIGLSEQQTKLSQRKFYLAESNLSRREKEIIHLVRWTSFLRDERKEFMNKAQAISYLASKKLLALWGVKENILLWLCPFEISFGREYFVANVKAILERQKGFCVLFNNDNAYEIKNFDIEKLSKSLDGYIAKHNDDNSDFIQGDIGCRGKVSGKTRIVFHKKYFPLFQKGEILVTSMTRPEFVPVMKKAKAIITDEGGITCHAAIVSRELGIPCIIGTKIATQVLKDGDLVQVDANRGVVKILKRAKG